jgi:hypothetical protein
MTVLTYLLGGGNSFSSGGPGKGMQQQQQQQLASAVGAASWADGIVTRALKHHYSRMHECSTARLNPGTHPT